MATNPYSEAGDEHRLMQILPSVYSLGFQMSRLLIRAFNIFLFLQLLSQ